jgi:hypothetical protein
MTTKTSPFFSWKSRGAVKKASLLCLLVCLLPCLSSLRAAEQPATPARLSQSLKDYFEPGEIQQQEPLPVKQIIGLVIAGLSSIVILLFVFSFLMGPGERIRDKVSEASDPFFTIVAILLLVLFLAMLQMYYNDIFAWLKTVVSSG